ncbi:chondroitin sulfate proteoglycan 4 isoform X1 [Anguilla rostrata]|uniref:chondroitin sulfate proteoglycan 4 isoform X1 n=2 Tax=Anguilla rostrata TaxID=7938 RepID=UPI0030CB664F
MRPLSSLACLLLALLALSSPSHGVSYFGDSICEIQAIQDVSTFHLSLQFKTSRRSGLLLLAGGVHDYLALELHNGRLRVRMDMGSGQVELESALSLQLNNLVEHNVAVSLEESRLTMVVDELYSTFLPFPNTQDVLNIDLGFYLGGSGNLEAPYLDSSIPPLRGCISNVRFESHHFDILDLAPVSCHDTKEGCSAEFEAGDGETISFISPDSFVSFPSWSAAEPRTLELLMKTTIEDALLVFHAGHQTDFIGVGVAGGYLKGVVDLGSGPVVLDNNLVQLDDDQWHRIKVQIVANMFDLTVDSQTISVPLSGSDSLDLTGNLYFGGLEAKLKEVFQESGLLTHLEEEIILESFIGCLGEMKVNNQEWNLQNALVTKDVHVKCEGEDYDYPNYYEPTDATTTSTPLVNVSTNERHCYPTDDTPEMFRNITKLIDVTTLRVPEGGETFLELRNLNPTLDLNKVGLRQSQIIFTLQNDPWYGLMDMNTNNKRTKKFTLLDVVNQKIKYIHDGNEKHGDQIQLEVSALGYSNLPDCLKNPHLYVLPVEIIPINDVPQVSGTHILITEYGRTCLGPRLIKIVDSDTRCDELKITIISAPNAEEGYLENTQQPGRSIKEFTCRQLKDGNICYVHRGGVTARLVLQVSDGQSASQATTFDLLTTSPQLTLVTNTGYLLPQGGFALIGIQNLAVSATPRNGDIVYNVTQALQFGELQMLTSDGLMKQVTTFRQSDLEQNTLRYVSTDSSDREDAAVELIRFDVQLGQLTLPDNTFMIKIIPSDIKMAAMVPLELKKGDQKVIKQELEAVMKGKNMAPESMMYTLVKVPYLGTLQLLDRELAEGDSFTQQDLMNSYLSYKVDVHRTTDMEDEFQFRVSAENQLSPVYTYPINILADPDAPSLINERFVVLEGGENIINKDYLWVQTRNSTDFVYRVFKDPRHGRLIRESPPGQPRFDGAIKVFSNEDLLLDRLIYQHDGSENSEDEFTFLTFMPNQEQNAISGIFRIYVQSSNDHVPVRVVDKIFNVVRNGQRLLTTDDIQFRDTDSGFNESQLVYMRAGILSGNIVSAMDVAQPLFRFTQADLREKRVLFVHHGADREKFQLQVSDGLHKTTALLEIQASDPYLRIVNNTIVIIDSGSTKTLNTSLLSIESNADIRDLSEIKYEVTSPPKDGVIIVSGIETSFFTQEDLRKGVVSYQHHDRSLRSKDSFGFTVQSKGLSQAGTFRIKIFKQGYLSEPQVIANEVIISYVAEHIQIDKDHLRVEQADILPSEMVYTIKELPHLGHIVMANNGSALDYVQSFSQEDINQGRILYVSASVQGSDAFIVEVNNGFTTVEDIRVAVHVVPGMIPVKTLNITLREGSGVPLSPDIVNISHPFYSSANIDFVVETPPQHGSIRYLDGEDDDVSFFTWDEMKQRLIYYLHDGSETTEDSFTLTASAFEIERSGPNFTIGITIQPVNDEPPRLVHNTGLELLSGEDAEITANMLYADDLDTPPEELVYSIEDLSNGIVVLRVSPGDSIENFTQAQINSGEVVFTHKGGPSGGFAFTVTDGEHTSPLQHFLVTARPLTISMDTQEELIVFPGTRQPITSEILKATTNEDGDEITYSVQRAPRLGRLISANNKNQFQEISTFTQAELDSGSIFYEHQMPEEPFWVVRDSVELLLSSSPAQDLKHVLPITVSFYAENHNSSTKLWRNAGLDLLKGQKKVIDSSRLDASNLLASVPESRRGSMGVVFEVIQFPSHGTLMLGDVELPKNTPYFLQEEVNKGELEYDHGGDPEPLSDSFFFRAWLNPSGRRPQTPAPSSEVLEEPFSIAVTGGQREPPARPELVSVDLLLEVLQGSSAVVTPQHLSVADQDSTPADILFTVTRPPANGRLVHAETGSPMDKFTQEDVNGGRVTFVSDGSLANGFLEFTVSDGRHRTESHSLHIGVLARTLQLALSREIQVRQGDDETLVTEAMLKATTGGPSEEEVIYKITNVPEYAAMMVDRQPTSAFTQRQIREGRVSVRFVKSTSPRDCVAVLARSRAANASAVLNITATPLVNLPRARPLLPRASTVLVDQRLLDASPLANKTMEVPTFRITRQPRSACFVRVGGKEDGRPISTFTQKDVEEGRIGLEVLKDLQAGDSVQDDRFEFLLQAHGVPPAEGTLSFRTAPYKPSAVYGAKVLKVPSPDAGSSATTPSPDHSERKPVVSRPSNLWAILIPILVILLLLLLALALAYYLVRRNKTGKHDVQNVAAKPKNGEVKQETFRKTDPANSIPMSSMDSKEPDPELLQHCRTTNPPLKKNQYWV